MLAWIGYLAVYIILGNTALLAMVYTSKRDLDKHPVSWATSICFIVGWPIFLPAQLYHRWKGTPFDYE